MTLQLNHFDLEYFKSSLWNKKEYFVNNAHSFCLNSEDQTIIPNFDHQLDQICHNKKIEKRIICGSESNYHYEISGQADRKKQSHPQTVFINNIDQWMPEFHQIYHLLNFIPRYRIEDLMLSLSNFQGSSGPHVDFYDVFIFQLSGSKEWRVEKNLRSEQECSEDHLMDNSEIKLLNDFSTDYSSYHLQPGDLLYVPSHLAHWAINQNDSESISLSVGLRAPKTNDFIWGMANTLASLFSDDHRLQHSFFSNHNPFELKASNLENFNLPILTKDPKELLLLELGKLFTDSAYFESEQEISEEEQEFHIDPDFLSLKPNVRFCFYKNKEMISYFFNGNVIQTNLDLTDSLTNYFNQQTKNFRVPMKHTDGEMFVQFLLDNDLLQL